MRVLLCVGLGLASLSGIAMAAETPTDKVICKRTDTAETGSRLNRSKKVCHTKSEWKQMELAAERTMQKIGESGSVDSRGASAGAGPH
jgi:hypothetical protein